MSLVEISSDMGDDIVCVVEDYYGRIKTQLVKQPFECPEGGHIILYQKGLTIAERLPSRKQNVLSCYFVEFENQRVRIPWANVVWAGDEKMKPEERGASLIPSCEELVVVRLVEQDCQVIFGWFVVGAKVAGGWLLVEVDRDVVRDVISSSKLPAAGCGCGRCEHPLKTMMRSNVPSVPPTEIAARSFSSLRRAIGKEMRSPRMSKTRYSLRNAIHRECIVCYERCAAEHCCPSKQCNTTVCTRCKERLRGLCPLCDRSKISSFYECESCSKVVRLEDFGAPCIDCPTMLCVKCYAHYARCKRCSSKAAKKSMRPA